MAFSLLPREAASRTRFIVVQEVECRPAKMRIQGYIYMSRCIYIYLPRGIIHFLLFFEEFAKYHIDLLSWRDPHRGSTAITVSS